MESFVFAFNALAPLLALALLGYFLRASRLVGATFIEHLNRYIFYVALPVLIFNALADMGDFSRVNLHVVFFAVAMIFVIVMIGYVFLRFFKTADKHKPVLLQGFFRGNFVLIGIPLAIRLGGDEALTVIVILNAFLIPLTNLMSILVFKLWRENGRFTWKKFGRTVKETITNPLMIAVFLGLAAFALQAQWLAFSERVVFVPETLELIAATATPMALVAVGGQFRAKRSRDLLRPLIAGVSGRLVVVPAFAFSLAALLSGFIRFEGSWAGLVSIFASPVAVASVAVTKGLEGDEELAGQLVIWSTAMAVFTLFFLIVIFRQLGLL